MSDRGLIALIAAVVVLVIGFLLFRDLAVVKETAPIVEIVTEEAVPTRTAARVKVTSCKRESELGRTVLTGYVQNVGNVDLHYVTVKSIWKNRDGQIVGTDTLYAVNGGNLRPGDRKDFSDVSETSNVFRCNAEALDWW